MDAGTPQHLGDLRSVDEQRHWLATVNQHVCEQVKQLRQERGWTHLDLIRQLGIYGFGGWHPNTLTRLESGDRNVKVSEALAFASIFQVSFSRLVGLNNEAPWAHDQAIYFGLQQRTDK